MAPEHEGARLMLKRKRPAAIRPLDMTGKVPVTDDEDGRHPKHENHGRIAGR
jgi:hypothetical protein